MRYFPFYNLIGTGIASTTETVIMKKLLLAASAVGTAIAGLILYYQRKNKTGNRIEDAAKNAYKTINSGIGSIERPAQHTI